MGCICCTAAAILMDQFFYIDTAPPREVDTYLRTPASWVDIVASGDSRSIENASPTQFTVVCSDKDLGTPPYLVFIHSIVAFTKMDDGLQYKVSLGGEGACSRILTHTHSYSLKG